MDRAVERPLFRQRVRASARQHKSGATSARERGGRGRRSSAKITRNRHSAVRTCARSCTAVAAADIWAHVEHPLALLALALFSLLSHTPPLPPLSDPPQQHSLLAFVWSTESERGGTVQSVGQDQYSPTAANWRRTVLLNGAKHAHVRTDEANENVPTTASIATLAALVPPARTRISSHSLRALNEPRSPNAALYRLLASA